MVSRGCCPTFFFLLTIYLLPAAKAIDLMVIPVLLDKLGLSIDPTWKAPSVLKNKMMEDTETKARHSPINFLNETCVYHSRSIPNCYLFELYDTGDILAANLILSLQGFNAKERYILRVFRYNKKGVREGPIAHMNIAGLKRGTIELNVAYKLKQLSLKARKKVILSVEIVHASSGPITDILTPFLDVVYNNTILRKEPECNEDSLCCLHPFYINFTAFGWSSWIIAPEGYYVNFCIGGCVAEPNSPKVAEVLRTLKGDMRLPSQTCAPTTYESLRVMYAAGPYDVRVTVLEEVRVTACSCLGNRLQEVVLEIVNEDDGSSSSAEDDD